MRTIALFPLIPLALSAADISLPSTALERDRPVTAIYRTNGKATGRGTLHLTWTDSYNRTVDQRQLPIELNDESEIAFPLDLTRAVAMKNRLEARFVFDGLDRRQRKDHREETAAVDFIARPPHRRWSDYQIVMWQPYSSELTPLLLRSGISAGQYVGRNRAPAKTLLDHDLRWYAENIATDFYAEYHRYRPDRRSNEPFYEAKELYKRNPAGKEAFKRHPSLSDAAWLDRIYTRLTEIARDHSSYRPLFYDLGDESGVADLSAYWDFDFSDHSLSQMRIWLHERYGSLAALNAQWGSKFATWNEVTPDTTDEAMRRPDRNWSSWADHKEWMDVAFARAAAHGVRAIKSVDPDAHVGFAGAQMPGWGGYDYARLTEAIDFFEPYDIGNNIEIIRSLAPATPVVTTSFARGPWEKHRVWYEFLHGNRGLIIWDEKREFAADAAVGPRGEETGPYYRELRAGLGALLIQSRRVADPIAIHYSQASFRTAWMTQHQPKGDAWTRRNASTERLDSGFLRLRESFCRLLEDLGLQYDFVSYLQLERGELANKGYRVLILPDSNSLSAREAEEIRRFVESGGRVIAAGDIGTHDEHSRKLETPRLAGLESKIGRVEGDVLAYHQQRLLHKEGAVHSAAAAVLASTGVAPRFRLRAPGINADGIVGLERHEFRNGGVTIVGLHGNPQLRVDELGPPEFKSNERFEKPHKARLLLPEEMHVYDIRKGRALGRQRELAAEVDPYEPTLYALSPSAIGGLAMSAPSAGTRGQTVRFSLRIASPAATHVFHVDVIDPAGQTLRQYSGNHLAPRGVAGFSLPLAFNDPAGRWQIRVRDILSGQTAEAAIEVK